VAKDDPKGKLAIALVGSALCAGTAMAATNGPPSAFADPGGLVVITETKAPEMPQVWVASTLFFEWRARTTTFTELASLSPSVFNLTSLGEPARVSAAMVSANILTTLGARPAIGRAFAAGEDTAGRDAVVVLSHAFWAQRFGGRADAIQKTLTLDGRAYTIVGVMPPSFALPIAADVYRRPPPQGGRVRLS
jgi:hypothetical protein